MNPLHRFRQWIAEPLLARLREELQTGFYQVTVDRQREAYDLGRAHGELAGQQTLLTELTRLMDERGALTYEVTPADLERAKKGMVH